MAERIIQCCYTNAIQEIGGKISSGWQPVALSKDVPAEAYSTCVSLQSANSTIQNAMVDERGNVLNLFEISGDGAYVYVIRTQYGLIDRLGRANMFSHAFIFSWKDEGVIDDPNFILSIDRDNFKDSENDAIAIPESLKRVPYMDISDAMRLSGLDTERYLKLIQCVFTQMTERKVIEPLFIQYDGSELQMRALLFCIYYGLPHHLKRTISVASNTTNNDVSKNVVFSENASQKPLFFDPQSGDNNVLTERTERKIGRYGFADYVARNITNIDASGYFDRLEDIAIELGDSTASNELILKIAHQLIQNPVVDSYSDIELDNILSDALRSKSSSSNLMEKYIAAMLNKVIERKLFLTDESEMNLADKLVAPITQELAITGENYNIYRFSMLSISEAAKKLSRMNRDLFVRYSRKLAGTNKGLEILDYYYSTYDLVPYELSWDKLNGTLDEISYMVHKPKTIDKLQEYAWQLYCTQIRESKSAIDAYTEYTMLMKKIIPSDEIDGCCYAAKEEYWESVTFSNFSLLLGTEYTFMQIGTRRCEMFANFFSILYNASQYNGSKILNEVNTFFSKYSIELASENTDDVFSQINVGLSKKYSGNDVMLMRWVHIVASIETTTLLKEIIIIRDQLYRCKYDQVVENFRRMSVDLLCSRNYKNVINDVSGIIYEFCKEQDSDSHCVPLDVWLCLGDAWFSNPFTVFDKIKPAILTADSSYVISESILLREKQYIRFAESYVHERGNEAKTVKKWLSEMKQTKSKKPIIKPLQNPESVVQASYQGRGFSTVSNTVQGKGKSSERSKKESATSEKKKKVKSKGFFSGK